MRDDVTQEGKADTSLSSDFSQEVYALDNGSESTFEELSLDSTTPELDSNARTENGEVTIPDLPDEIEPEFQSVESLEADVPQSFEQPDAPDLTEEQLVQQIGNLRSQIDSFIYEMDETNDALENAQGKHERILAIQEEFADWVDKRRASYAWKLVERLRGYRNTLNADEASIRVFAAQETNLEFGFAEKTRRWFMKRFMLNFIISWISIIILYLIHRFAEDISTWVSDNVSNIEIQKFLELSIEYITGPGFRDILLFILGLSFVHFIGLLFAYSRRNSEYSQHVAEESARTLAMDNGIHDVREARERIDSLHPQVPQVLEVLSLGLHNPWKVSDETMLFSGSTPDASRMPASLEIAVPTISKSSPVYEELVYRTMNEIQIPGWRSEAFSRVIQEVANSIGFGHNGMALRELDEDQRRSGKRQLLLSNSKEMAPFVSIGEALVEKLTATTQQSILPKVQPLVATLKPNPLADLELSGSLLKDDTEEISRWEIKLSEIAGHAAPWSSETFSNAGAANKKHESLESVFLASDRVKDLAVDSVEAHADVQPGSRPFEVAIRVDLSQWCKPNEVAIFEDFQPSSEQLLRWNQLNPDSLNTGEDNFQSEAPTGLVI